MSSFQLFSNGYLKYNLYACTQSDSRLLFLKSNVDFSLLVSNIVLELLCILFVEINAGAASHHTLPNNTSQ